MFELLLVLFDGIVLGCIYALVALGLTITYGILRVLNIAQGDILMMGAFVGLMIVTVLHLNYAFAIIGAIVFCGAFAIVAERVAFRPLRTGPALGTLVSSLAVSVILENVALMLFGGNPQFFQTSLLNDLFHIGGASFSAQRVLIVAATAASVGGLWAILKWTYLGKGIRAVSQDAEVASLMGINVNGMIVLAFVVSFGLAGAAGVLVAPILLVSPLMGQTLTLKAFAIIVLGGFGNASGAILAALVIGVAESVTSTYISGAWADSLAFVILIVVLIVRPTGLIRERLEQNV